jgi:HAMP domain-containing protein
MARSMNSIQTKLTLSFGILVLVMSCLTFFYTYSETKKTIKDITRNELKIISTVAALALKGEDLSEIKPGSEKTARFLRIRDLLQDMEKSNPDIKYIYTYVKNDDKSVKFAVDADYGIKQASEVAKPGEVYTDTDAAMLEGLEKPSADSEFSNDKWGTFLSGYAPVKGPDGKITGAVGVDMLKNTVIAKQNFIGDTIYIIFGAAIVLTAILITFFSITLVRDIRELNSAVREMARGNPDFVTGIKRSDEIGELDESLKMLAKKMGRKI